jgi:hypothetical protein
VEEVLQTTVYSVGERTFPRISTRMRTPDDTLEALLQALAPGLLLRLRLIVQRRAERPSDLPHHSLASRTRLVVFCVCQNHTPVRQAHQELADTEASLFLRESKYKVSRCYQRFLVVKSGSYSLRENFDLDADHLWKGQRGTAKHPSGKESLSQSPITQRSKRPFYCFREAEAKVFCPFDIAVGSYEGP